MPLPILNPRYETGRSKPSGFAGSLEQLANLVQNDHRPLAFLQERINKKRRIIWNMRHAGEHQNTDIRLDLLRHCGHITPFLSGMR
jgi:hypothetical protein